MYKLKHENCACCNGEKQKRTRQYCDDCSDRIRRITSTMPIDNKIDLVRIDLAIRDKARAQAEETRKQRESNPDKCINCWAGRRVSETTVFCFVPGMCHKSGEYREGRTT